MAKVAVVTGAGRGIGRAIAERLASGGYSVVIGSRTLSELDAVAADIRKTGGTVLAQKVDVSSEAELISFAETALALGPVEALVNNAGVSPKPRKGGRTPLTEMTVSEWDDVMRINLTSAFVMSRELGRAMCAAGRGTIVNISSIAIRNGGLTAGAHYVASKAGMVGLTKAMAREFAPSGVRVNVIAPGRVTSALTAVSNKLIDAGWTEREIPLRREGRPEEVADAVEFLVSDRSSFITGMTLDVTGGWSMP